MVFSSIIFVFVFLPVVLISYYLAEGSGKIQFKNLVVLVASLIFYSWGGMKYLFLLIGLVIINYLCGLMIEKSNRKGLFLILGLSVDIIDLLFFKYMNFIADNLGIVCTKIAGREISFNIPSIALPIGISFFTFQIMSYIIDVYKGVVPAQKNIWRLMLYIMMFPQLIAGPIVRYSDVNREIENRHTTLEMAEAGVKRFIIGFAKKVFVANAMGAMADAVFGLSGQFNSVYAWIGAISYTLQIYYDFSAYSDMAIGLGLIFGFHFNENFNYPYISGSIQEFWRRWHISLSTWFRDYVYIPLGGNRKGKARTYLNLWIVFLLTGIWHGAAWQFIIWGLYHGLFMFIERLGFGKVLKRLPVWIGRIYTGIVVIVGWVFFRADNIEIAINYIKNMFTINLAGFNVDSVLFKFTYLYYFMLIVAIIASTPVFRVAEERFKNKRLAKAGYLILFFITLTYLAGLSYNPFIYFKF
ncbi:MBOAT family O-acyltransferase [Butyrivibrio sp. WCE2006]|uniref:MBOAT family O-acyltransferase n=1 Tax=Butyrivibrio sp. WCE2006 TaxID=1410611 RepID=UPI0005D23F7E|nr:MBOAT family O-acyltransferase [Butyrivibrio sp. WCE2006]